MAQCGTASRFGGEDGGVALAEAPSAYPVPPEERTGPLWDALREVMDPEIPISLVDLGLIYDIRRDGAAVEVDLTFTATAPSSQADTEQADLACSLLFLDAVGVSQQQVRVVK